MKYAAIVLAMFISIGIISGGVTLFLAIVHGLSGETGSRNQSGFQEIVYQDEDGGVVIMGIKIGGEQETISFTKQFEEEEIKSLQINNGSGELILQAGEQFKVDAENVPEDYVAEVKDGVLIVKRESGTSWKLNLFFNTKKQKVTITVPEQFLAERVSIVNGSGSLTVEELHTKKLLLQTGSGTALLKRSSSEWTEIDKGSGKMQIYDAILGSTKIENGSGGFFFENVVTENFKMQNGSGRVSYAGEMSGNCVFRTGSGNVSLSLKASEKEYDITASVGSGGFYINGKSRKNTDIRNESAKHSMAFEGGSGRISVEFSK